MNQYQPQMPSMPEVPSESLPDKKRSGWLVVGFTAVSLLILLALVSVVSVGFTIVLGGIIGLILFHYLVWGWWLGRIITDEEAAAE